MKITRLLTVFAFLFATNLLTAQCTATVNTFPYQYGFENGLGDYFNYDDPSLAEVVDFYLQSGASPIQGTGPSGAFEGNNYVYAYDNIHTQYHRVGAMGSPCFDLTGLALPEMRIHYHMLGAAVGNLVVQSSTDGGITWWEVPGQPDFDLDILGDQGNTWHEAVIDLSEYSFTSQYQFRFGVMFNTGEFGVVAVDNIIIEDKANCINPPTVTGTVIDATLPTFPNGSIDVTVTGGTAPFQFNLSNGATTEDVNALLPGNYDVTITDAAGCQQTLNFTVGYPICSVPPTLSVVTSTTSGIGNADGSADLTITGGQAPFLIFWSNGAQTEDLSNLAPGHYSVYVTDANLCEALTTIYISDPLNCNGTKSNWPYAYGFENKGLGLFKQNKDDNMNWKRKSGSTSTAGTGPSSAYKGNYYRYLEANGQAQGNTGVITIKKCMNINSLTEPVLSFYYHMYGADMGRLEVQVSTDGGNNWSESIWSVYGDQGNNWVEANIDLTDYKSNQTRVRIVGVRGDGDLSDIAIDDVFIGELSQAQNREDYEETEEDELFVQDANIKLFPNPVVDQLTLSFESAEAYTGSLQIFNSTGQLLKTETAEIINDYNEINLQVNDLPVGMYYLVLSGNELKINRPFVVNRK